MARIYPLFSSSKGNAAFIGNSSGGILIDAGVTYKRLCEGLENCGLSIDAVKAIFITHEHSDHIKGLPVLTKRKNIPVFAQKGTLNYLFNCDYINSEGFEISEKVTVCDMEIACFDTPHDSLQSCGYKIAMGDGKICCTCTDLGYMPDEVFKMLSGSDLVLLESNYDDKMLLNGPYPYYLKSRIRSQSGHLSNKDCAENVRKLIELGTSRIILGHLSQENNTPKTAENAVLKMLDGFERNRDYLLEVAPVETQGKCMIF